LNVGSLDILSNTFVLRLAAVNGFSVHQGDDLN